LGHEKKKVRSLTHQEGTIKIQTQNDEEIADTGRKNLLCSEIEVEGPKTMPYSNAISKTM
jgi:hypothetical protein